MLLFRHQKSTRAKTFFAVLMLVTSSLLCSCSYSPLYGQRAGSDLKVTKNFELIDYLETSEINLKVVNFNFLKPTDYDKQSDF